MGTFVRWIVFPPRRQSVGVCIGLGKTKTRRPPRATAHQSFVRERASAGAETHQMRQGVVGGGGDGGRQRCEAGRPPPSLPRCFMARSKARCTDFCRRERRDSSSLTRSRLWSTPNGDILDLGSHCLEGGGREGEGLRLNSHQPSTKRGQNPQKRGVWNRVAQRCECVCRGTFGGSPAALAVEEVDEEEFLGGPELHLLAGSQHVPRGAGKLRPHRRRRPVAPASRRPPRGPRRRRLHDLRAKNAPEKGERVLVRPRRPSTSGVTSMQIRRAS